MPMHAAVARFSIFFSIKQPFDYSSFLIFIKPKNTAFPNSILLNAYRFTSFPMSMSVNYFIILTFNLSLQISI
jgi:hypothetical protein